MSARQDDWDTYLVYIEFAYNNSLNVSTGCSPFVLQFAQSPRAPWDLFNATEPDDIHRGNLRGSNTVFLEYDRELETKHLHFVVFFRIIQN